MLSFSFFNTSLCARDFPSCAFSHASFVSCFKSGAFEFMANHDPRKRWESDVRLLLF